MNETQTMGQRIAALRKNKQLTQDALAQELGVSPQAVSKWEHDLSCPDIALLPRLAKVLGTSADYLLGGEELPLLPEGTPEPEEPVDDRPGIHVESSGDNHFDVRFESPRRASFTGAAWLILAGLLMLAGAVLKLGSSASIGFWSACGISALIVWGVSGMIRRVKLSNLLMTLAGVYLALSGLNFFRLNLGWDVLFPGLILLLGVSLLLETLRKKHRRTPVFHISGPCGGNASEMYVRDGFLTCSGAFSGNRYNVNTPLLKGGDVSVSFGEHILDLSGVEAVADHCRIEVNSSFGETVLRIPSRFRVELRGSRSFAETNVCGHPDPEPEGIIHIDASVSFGELSIRYI